MATPIRVYRIPGAPDQGANLPKLPTYGFSDNFARPDAAMLGSTLGGKPWQIFGTVGNTQWGVESNEARLISAGGSGNRSIAWVDSGASDGLIRIVAGTVFSSGAGIAARCQDINNNIFLNSGDGIALWKRVAGSSIRLGRAAGAITAGDVIDLVMDGADLAVRRNGVELFTAQATEFQGETRHGLRVTASDLATRWASITHTP